MAGNAVRPVPEWLLARTVGDALNKGLGATVE